MSFGILFYHFAFDILSCKWRTVYNCLHCWSLFFCTGCFKLYEIALCTRLCAYVFLVFFCFRTLSPASATSLAWVIGWFYALGRASSLQVCRLNDILLIVRCASSGTHVPRFLSWHSHSHTWGSRALRQGSQSLARFWQRYLVSFLPWLRSYEWSTFVCKLGSCNIFHCFSGRFFTICLGGLPRRQCY